MLIDTDSFYSFGRRPSRVIHWTTFYRFCDKVAERFYNLSAKQWILCFENENFLLKNAGFFIILEILLKFGQKK